MNYDIEDLYRRHAGRESTHRPLIGITGNFGERGCELAEGYYRSISAAGGIPMALPPTTAMDDLPDLLERLDGIVLSGGADLNPLWVGEEPTPQLGSINPVRDARELLLVRLASDRQIPLLGICRGMQVMAAAMGGTVDQDIAVARTTDAPALVKHSQDAPRHEATHSVQLAEGSWLTQIFGQEHLYVNSFHHQAVRTCGPMFRPAAWATDGVVEAMEAADGRSLWAVQWHPECMETGTMAPLFRHFVDEARNYRRARTFHERHLTLDSHCDTPMFFHLELDFAQRDPRILVDLPKMREGGLDASIMVAYLPQRGRTDAELLAASGRADALLDRLNTMVTACPGAAMAYTPAQIRAHKTSGLRSIIPGIENAYAFGKDLTRVAHFRRRGVVYATLCHNGHNDICDSARPSPADQHAFPTGSEHEGLSAFGRTVVHEMNRTGMMIDLSHGAESSFYAAIDASAVPIVCSHSSARALCDHPRNLTDHQLRTLAASGGVAQCTFYKGFLNAEADRANLDDAVAHLLHMISVAGIDHVGIGTDFDGDGGVPGLADASQLLHLTRRLQAEGLTDGDLAKVWGGNFLRVMQSAQDAAATEFQNLFL